MSESVWADVLDALYDLTIAEAFIAAEIAADRLSVADGAVVNDFSAPSLLVVGGLPINDNEQETTSSWDWATLGRDGTHADVTDVIAVPFGVQSLLGEADVRAARRSAITIYAKVAALVRGTAMSQRVGQVMWCIPRVGALTQANTADGAECLLSFTVNVHTRI